MSNIQDDPIHYVNQLHERQQRRKERQSLSRRSKRKLRHQCLLSTSFMSLDVVDQSPDLSESEQTSITFGLRTQDKMLSSNQQLDDTELFINHEVDSNESDISTTNENEFDETNSILTYDSEHESIDETQDLMKYITFSTDDQQLYPSSNIAIREFSIKILEFCRSSRLPHSQRIRLLQLFQTYLPIPNYVPATTDALLNSLGIEKLYTSRKLCGICYSTLSRSICMTTNCTYENMKVPADQMIEIVTFNVIEQLRLLISKNLKLLRQYQDQARSLSTSDLNDIVCADVYNSLLTTFNEFFVSLMIHTDGIPLYKSKNYNAWPILSAVLELPPYARTRADNILLLGIWFGKQKPKFDIVFNDLFPQLLTLKAKGIQIDGINYVKVILPMLMGDMPALSTMVQFVEPHAFYACMFCETKGVFNHNGHCIVYPVDNTSPLRTTENFQQRSQLAGSMQNRLDRKRTMGHKGVSIFSDILDVPLPHSVVIDAMHTVFLCHGKKILIYLKTCITKDNLNAISKKMASIGYVHDILRRPRSLYNVNKWKASEVRVFILYIGLPVLVEFLAPDESGDLALYIVILRLLHDFWNNNKDFRSVVSNLLTIYVNNLLDKINSNICPPNLATITTHTHIHLPLQCQKFGRLDWLTNFVFESFLGYLKGFVKGSSGAGDQIAFAFISNFFLSKLQTNPNLSHGDFRIDDFTFGMNILKLFSEDSFKTFLIDQGYSSSKTIYFARLRRHNVIYHSFLYTRRRSSCSYLIRYEKQGSLFYGFILCFLLNETKCSAVIQRLKNLKRSLTSYFSTYKYITAIKNFIDELYIIVKRADPSLFLFDDIDVCSIESLRSRCFYIPFNHEFMVITEYNCAYEHN